MLAPGCLRDAHLLENVAPRLRANDAAKRKRESEAALTFDQVQPVRSRHNLGTGATCILQVVGLPSAPATLVHRHDPLHLQQK